MSEGLEGVVAARTVLSDVDGAAGHLIIRGYSLDDLAGRTRFEDVAHLLFDGFFDDMPADLTRALGEARVAVFAETAAMDERLLKLNPVEAMRALWARLADGDGLDTALKLLAAPAVFTPAVVRAQAGQSLVPPDPALRHSADILRMLRGRPAAEAEADALDDADLVARLRDAGPAQARRFSWARAGQATAAVYDRALAEAAGGGR